jgi:transposase
MKTSEALNEKIESITERTLIVGIDVAKVLHWARFVDYRGIEHGKALAIVNDMNGFKGILSTIRLLCNDESFNDVVVGMEPTGHYWKALANYLVNNDVRVVLVNPYHTKRAKELDDNSPTKSAGKDALTIARLVKDGRFFETYLPRDAYADLRILGNARESAIATRNAAVNRAHALPDEFFPEFVKVFKRPFEGKTSMWLLKTCPSPGEIVALGVDGVLAEIKKAVSRGVGINVAVKLVNAAGNSVGVDYGVDAFTFGMRRLVEEIEFLNAQIEETEAEMAVALKKTGLAEFLLSVKGFGVVGIALVLGEIGDPLRFDDPRQLYKLAGYDLVEDSSGKSKSGTKISKRGRKGLRRILYIISMALVSRNPEMKRLHAYMKTRGNNPLTGNQSLVVIAKKALSIIFTLSRKREAYDAEKVFGAKRASQLAEAA